MNPTHFRKMVKVFSANRLILISKDQKRAFGMEYNVQFIKEHEIVHETTILSSDISSVDKSHTPEWEGVPVAKKWSQRVLIKDIKNITNPNTQYIKLPGKKSFTRVLVTKRDKVEFVKCEFCKKELSLRYVKAKGLRCPDCRKAYEDANKEMTAYFKQKGDLKAKYILKNYDRYVRGIDRKTHQKLVSRFKKEISNIRRKLNEK